MYPDCEIAGVQNVTVSIPHLVEERAYRFFPTGTQYGRKSSLAAQPKIIREILDEMEKEGIL